MAYKFYTEKVNTAQEETAYILYMIISSYFHKCYCQTKAVEKKLFLYYKEMNKKYQMNCEKRIIRDMEKTLASQMENFGAMNCAVRMERVQEYYEIFFYTGLENVMVRIDESGQYNIEMILEAESA